MLFLEGDSVFHLIQVLQMLHEHHLRAGSVKGPISIKRKQLFYADQAECFWTSLKRWGEPACTLVCGHNVMWAVMTGWAPCWASAGRANVGVMKHPASSVITRCGPTSQKNMHQLQVVLAPELQYQHKYNKSEKAFLYSVYPGVWNVMVSWRICRLRKL